MWKGFCGGFLLVSSMLHGQAFFNSDDYQDKPLSFTAGILAGGMNCLTDLGGGRKAGRPGYADLNLGATRWTAGWRLQLQYRFWLGLRIYWVAGQLSAADRLVKSTSPPAVWRKRRNLQFQSRIREAGLLVNVFPTLMAKEASFHLLEPYLLTGLSAFDFDPRAGGIRLQPLRTERNPAGPYALRQLAWPIGLGLRYRLPGRWRLSIEWLHRVLFTDYLDDVSGSYPAADWFDQFSDPEMVRLARTLSYGRSNVAQPGGRRGNPSRNDSYFTVCLVAGFLLGR